jgi:3-dehydroquinate dehydratase-1
MTHAALRLTDGQTRVVGSIGCAADLGAANPTRTRESCDIVEIRLDLLLAATGGADPAGWQHLLDSPLLFTARRHEEGGAGALSAAARIGLLERVLNQAAAIDIEVASRVEMGALLQQMRARGIPWVASFHDFECLPATAVLADAAQRARDAGASVFKAAARLHQAADLARLAEFQLADHGLPVATMGMGPLAPVSRLLCAQHGSVLNYGCLGTTPTAPGQWDAGFLKQALARLVPLGSGAI